MTSSASASQDRSIAGYESKRNQYFIGARQLFVDGLPVNPTARLLELGCGSGNTAAMAFAQKKCGWTCGVELCPGPAAEAAAKMDQVIVGNIERLTLELPPKSFDVLLVSEVLEHLTNPLSVLQMLHGFLKPGAVVMAGSPNVCHHSVLRMLFQGGWDYQQEGIMDATHLRWFSPRTYKELFENAGYLVEHVGPANPLGWKASLVNELSFHRFEHLFFSQIFLKARCR